MFAPLLLSLAYGPAPIGVDHVTRDVAAKQAKAFQVKRDLTKGNTLYLIPYAHLDTQWRWTYPQVIREFIWNTMADNLALIDKYPNYVFNFSGSRRYEMMQEYYPEEYAKVVAAVKAGRWFPCGSSVDENDANVPSGESLVRQVLYGNNWFRKNLGVASNEYMLPDCFGFPYALPSVLNHCGIEGFSTQKLTWGSAVGIPFKVGNWIGPDGTGVVAALDPGGYTGSINEDLSQNTSWLARIQDTGKKSGAYVDYHYYGTGDRGGAPGEGSVAMAETSIKGKGPITCVSAPADQMFMSLTAGQKDRLPVYQGELLLTEHSAGSITSQAYMKRFNRKSELLADAAERAAVAAKAWTGAEYPSDRLYQGWDLVLGSQMHDMLPGTSLPKAYEYCYNDYLLALNLFGHAATDAVGSVAKQMDTRAQGTPIVVQNSLSIPRQDVVEAWVPGTGPVTVFAPDGSIVPTQLLGHEDGKTHLLFLANVPANGFAAFDARPVAAKQRTTLKADGKTLESPRFRVTLNSAGDIASIYDKVNKKESLKSPARLDFQYHNPAAYPAWNMDWQDAQKPPFAHVDGPAKIRIVEAGPVRVAIEVTRESQGSKFVQTVRLSAGKADDRVEVQNHIDWSSRECAVKAAFPLTTANPKATYDLQLGVAERGNNDPKKYEVPQHQWFDLTQPDGKYGVAILNDSKFGSDKPSDDTVRLTLLYTPGVRAGFQDQAVQDFGRHDILYAIAPHAGDWRTGKVAWTAKRLNQPLTAYVTEAHNGRLGRSNCLAALNTDQVEIQAIKMAEDGDGYIVRLRELTGKPANNVRIGMMPGVASAEEVDGQERPIAKTKVQDGSAIGKVRGYGLAAYRVRLMQNRMAMPQPKSTPVALAYDLDVVSTDKNRKDGAFDAQGNSYPAEQLPKALTVDGISFKLGSTANGAKNALTAKGQSLRLPAGTKRVYVLAAATEDTTPTFKVGSKNVAATVPSWTGYVGQWDTRLWVGVEPEQAFNWNLPFDGVAPGYVKDAEVAWYASHRHLGDKGNGFYQYSYLFKVGLDVPKGANKLTLPNDPRVRIFAVTAASGTTDSVKPAQPLYDDLSGRSMGDAPKFTVPPVVKGEGVSVTASHPTYWHGSSLVYTTDGSAPTAQSAKVEGPIFVGKPTTLKAAEVLKNGNVGPVAEVRVVANDTTPPVAKSVSMSRELGLVQITFSEPLDPQTAAEPKSYIVPGAKVASTTLSPDGATVTLSLTDLSEPEPNARVQALARDRSGNTATTWVNETTEIKPVFTAPELAPSKSQNFNSAAPSGAHQTWTINFWVKTDKEPEPRTVLAGFGRVRQGVMGEGRYLTSFARGINFWVEQQDVATSAKLDIGRWQMLTATFDGHSVRIYKDGQQIGEGHPTLADDSSRVSVMPRDPWDNTRVFNGEIRDFTIWNAALPATAVAALVKKGNP